MGLTFFDGPRCAFPHSGANCSDAFDEATGAAWAPLCRCFLVSYVVIAALTAWTLTRVLRDAAAAHSAHARSARLSKAGILAMLQCSALLCGTSVAIGFPLRFTGSALAPALGYFLFSFGIIFYCSEWLLSPTLLPGRP